MAELLLLGSNLGLGAATVRMSDSRSALPVVEEGREFPHGVCGLIPVESTRKSGAVKVAYAFPLGAEGASWNIEDGMFFKSDERRLPDDFLPAEPQGVVDPQAGPAASDDVYFALLDAIDVINEMLDEGTELTGHPFGYVDAIRIGVPWRGSGYTRVLRRPLDDEGGPSETPIHLVVETSLDPGSPDTLTAIVRYDQRGRMHSMLLTEYGERNYWCRIQASINYSTHRMDVYKVEEYDGHYADGRLLYKRGYKSWAVEKNDYR